jgi:hypothetical protein
MHWWLMPAILATQEAEIRRIEVRGQSRQIMSPYLERQHHEKKKKKKGLVEWLKV